MHDAIGCKLNIGDVVLIPAQIKDLSLSEDYCNVMLETIFGRRPDGNRETIYAINTGVILRANPGDENDMAVLILGPEGRARLEQLSRQDTVLHK